MLVITLKRKSVYKYKTVLASYIAEQTFYVKTLNTMSQLNSNAIINGFIDYYCLVCETYCGTAAAAEQHVHKQVHKTNLETYTYMKKYEGDCIRKVKAGYYCEYCNILLPKVAKANLHVQEKTHKDNKAIALLKYVEEEVVAFNNVVIKKEAWHGFSGYTCAICNCDVEDFVEHKSNHAHILKLVQGTIQFYPNNNIYRNINESAWQCLTCNKILAAHAFKEHFNGPEHLQIYSSCINNNIQHRHSIPLEEISSFTAEDKQSRISSSTSGNSLDEYTTKSKLFDSISEFQKNYINMNYESEKVFCKKCYIAVNFDYNEIKNHIEDHKNKSFSPLSSPGSVEDIYKTIDVRPKTESTNHEHNTDIKCLTLYPATDIDEKVNVRGTSSEATAKQSHIEQNKKISATTLKTFAKHNNISYTEGNPEAHCILCNVKLPASLINITEHVNGSKHKQKPAQKCSGNHTQKQRMKEFINELYRFQREQRHDVVVINDDYCLPSMSYVMIKKVGSKLRCLYCKATFYESNVKEHIKNHNEARDRLFILLRDDDEFIREMRDGTYHCGYCNIIVDGWSYFEEHMKSDNHKQSKKSMNYYWIHLRPLIWHHKRERNMRVLVDIVTKGFAFPWYY